MTENLFPQINLKFSKKIFCTEKNCSLAFSTSIQNFELNSDYVIKLINENIENMTSFNQSIDQIKFVVEYLHSFPSTTLNVSIDRNNVITLNDRKLDLNA